jgi:transcriptional regulator with XRE-family HTH domain
MKRGRKKENRRKPYFVAKRTLIRARRKALGLSRQDVADLLVPPVTPSMIDKIENGRSGLAKRYAEQLQPLLAWHRPLTY